MNFLTNPICIIQYNIMTYQEYASFSPEVCGCSDPPQEEHISFLKHCATVVILVIELSHSPPPT